MPLQNRVQPTGEIITHPARGRFMGNRGILHDDTQTLGRARWRHKAWVTCVLSFKGRKRRLMTPHRYTELFFLDEAVAFAAGHRPCGECRRADYNRFRIAAEITSSIKLFDADLHLHRVQTRPLRQRRMRAQIDDLPDGAFVLDEHGAPALICHDALWPFAPEGYGAARIRPKGMEVTVLTPAPLVAALRGGYTLQTALTPQV
ncbi:hypothetical protein [Roseobacter weihaiensis]|uniref:hypothetical protein n=1 Tax=Roseobacter weihaiensis TaxID=2763262 RepID=UPI001D09F301|nr:hypothetical protein [Roseobacter sp. H9]